MYLDTSERGEMKALVGGLYVRWFIQKLEEISGAHIFRISVAFVLCLCGVFTAFFFLPRGSVAGSWVGFSIPVIMTVIIWISDRHRKRKMKEEMDPYPPESWENEIEQLEVTSQERQLFLKFLDVLQGESKEELWAVLDEIQQSPALSRLSFVREVNEWVK